MLKWLEICKRGLVRIFEFQNLYDLIFDHRFLKANDNLSHFCQNHFAEVTKNIGFLMFSWATKSWKSLQRLLFSWIFCRGSSQLWPTINLPCLLSPIETNIKCNFLSVICSDLSRNKGIMAERFLAENLKTNACQMCCRWLNLLTFSMVQLAELCESQDIFDICFEFELLLVQGKM